MRLTGCQQSLNPQTDLHMTRSLNPQTDLHMTQGAHCREDQVRAVIKDFSLCQPHFKDQSQRWLSSRTGVPIYQVHFQQRTKTGITVNWVPGTGIIVHLPWTEVRDCIGSLLAGYEQKPKTKHYCAPFFNRGQGLHGVIAGWVWTETKTKHCHAPILNRHQGLLGVTADWIWTETKDQA